MKILKFDRSGTFIEVITTNKFGVCVTNSFRNNLRIFNARTNIHIDVCQGNFMLHTQKRARIVYEELEKGRHIYKFILSL